MKRRLLFCWELGAGTGHVSPYLPLLSALSERGWEIVVAVRDTTEVADMLRPHGFRLVQAPVCAREFSGIPSASYNFAETLLHFGYGEERTLRSLVEAWLTLVDLVRPDFLLASAAPTAQWVAQAMGLPHAMIGSGFNCPPPTQPLPLLRDWAAGVELRLRNSEATMTSVMTTVNERVFHGGVFTPQRLFADSPDFLCTFKELDHYPARADSSVHYGILSARRFQSLPDAPCDVFAYLRNGPQTEAVVAALAQSGMRCLVYWPDAPDSNHRRHQSAKMSFADRAVALDKVVGGCRYVVGYASHHLTAEALLAGKPLLLMPLFLEQELTARAVERMGAGVSLAGKGRGQRIPRLLKQLHEDNALHDAARQFAGTYANWSAKDSIQALVARSESLISNVSAASRKVVAL